MLLLQLNLKTGAVATKKCVYMVVDEGSRIRAFLLQQGYELIVGNGTLNDHALSRCDAIIPGKAYITAEVLKKRPM